MINWNLKECKIENLKKVLNFLNENFSIEELDFIWKENKIKSKIFENPISKGYLIYGITENQKIIGSASLTIKKIFFKNEKIKVAEIGDTFTAQAKSYIDKNGYEKFKCKSKDDFNQIKQNKEILFIKKSIFGRLVEELKTIAANDKIALIYGTANANSSSSYINRLNFKRSKKDHVNEFFFITSKLIIQRFKYLDKANFFFNFILKILNNIYFSNLFGYKDLNIELISKPEEKKNEIDNFWHNYDFKSNVIIRDYEFLKWRYFNDNNYKLFFLYKNKQLVSWIVIRKKRFKEFYKITICDFLFNCSKKDFLYFFYEVLKKQNYQNCIVNFWTNIDKKIFSSKLFYKNKRINLIYHFIDKNIENDFDSIKNFTIGCSDNI